MLTIILKLKCLKNRREQARGQLAPNPIVVGVIRWLMPSSPPNQCSEFGCKLVPVKGSAFCEGHAPPVHVKKERLEWNKQYKVNAWDSIRMRQLSIMPLCQSCIVDGRVTQANHVDHLFPWRRVGLESFRNNIFQSLCSMCHGIKTGYERKGIFKHYLKGGTIDYKLTDYKGVIDGNENTAKANYQSHTEPG